MAPPDIDALIEEGLTKYGRGDLDGAMLAWEYALSLDPDNEQANSYVDYARQNYDLISGGDSAEGVGDEGGSPFAIEDDEYSIEIIEGGPLVQVAAVPYVDPIDEGWFMEEERVGFVAADSGSMAHAAPAAVVEIEAEEPPSRQTLPGPHLEAERTVEARALPDEDEPEIQVSAAPEPMSVTVEPISGEFPFGGNTRDFGDQLTEMKPRDLGFVKATARAADTMATIETPTVPAPAPLPVPPVPPPPTPLPSPRAEQPSAPEIIFVPGEPAAVPPPPVFPTVTIKPKHSKSAVMGAVEAIASALEAMANAAAVEQQEPTMQLQLSQIEVISDFSGNTTADGPVRALPDHEHDPADDVVPPPPPLPPSAAREPSKRATTITYEEARPRRASSPPELKMTLRTPTTRDKIDDAIAAADAMSDAGLKIPPPAAFGPEPTISVRTPAATPPPEPVVAPAAPAPEPPVATPPMNIAIRPPAIVPPPPPPAPAPVVVPPPAVIVPPPPANVFDPEPTAAMERPLRPPAPPMASGFSAESHGENSAFTRFGPRPLPSDKTESDLRAVPGTTFTPADLDDVAPPPPPSLARDEDRTRTRDLSMEPAPQRPTPERWPLGEAGAPTREVGQRSTRTDLVTSRPDARISAAMVDVGEGTRTDVVLPFDPIDARSAQILDDVDEGAPPNEPKDDRTRRRITTLIERAADWQRGTELDKAVTAIDLALAEDPNSALAQKLIHRNRDTIMGVFQSFVGDLQRAPILARPLHELSSAPISPRAAFLLSRVDGTMSIDEILDVSGMPRLEAYRYLCQLLLRGILR